MSESFAIPWTVAQEGSSVLRIYQAKVLEGVAIFFSRGSSQPKDRIMSLALADSLQLSHLECPNYVIII